MHRELRPRPADSPSIEALQPKDLGRATSLLIGILLLCAAVRTLVAVSHETISSDGAYFLRAAAEIERGDFELASAHRGFNVYPWILVGLHKLGLSLATGAKVWGILVATLTVLPLWGVFRRQFGERIALTAVFLYAVHPGLIEWSADPIRDATYWFLFSLSLYSLVRAIRSDRKIWLTAAVTAIIVAALTRTEGLLLSIPLTAAIAATCRRESIQRLGAGLKIVVPCFIAGQAYLGFQSASAAPSTVAASSTYDETTSADRRPTVDQSASPPNAVAQTAALSLRKRASNFAKRLVIGFHPVYGILCLIGLVRHRRMLRSLEQFALLVMNGLLFALIWYYLWRHGDMNTRYFYPIVICALPFTALGLSETCERAASGHGSPRLRRAVPSMASVALTVLGVATALGSNHGGRHTEALLGTTIAAACGENKVIAEFGGHYLPAHYARADRLLTLQFPPTDFTARQVIKCGADVVIVRGAPARHAACCEFVRRHPELYLQPVTLPDELSEEFAVYRRTKKTPSEAELEAADIFD